MTKILLKILKFSFEKYKQRLSELEMIKIIKQCLSVLNKINRILCDCSLNRCLCVFLLFWSGFLLLNLVDDVDCWDLSGRTRNILEFSLLLILDCSLTFTLELIDPFHVNTEYWMRSSSVLIEVENVEHLMTLFSWKENRNSINEWIKHAILIGNVWQRFF